MNPKIFFKYSGIYDLSLYHFSTGDTKDANDPQFKSRKEFVLNKIKEISEWWSSEGDEILSKIVEITGIKWEQTGIKIYLLAEAHRDTWMGGFSEPVTIFLKKSYNGKVSERNFIDIKRIIIHELMHQNISLMKDYGKYIEFLQEKYRCDRTCAAHILLYAIFEKLHSKEEFEYELRCKHNPSYTAAFEIVKKQGSNSILEEFRKWH